MGKMVLYEKVVLNKEILRKNLFMGRELDGLQPFISS